MGVQSAQNSAGIQTLLDVRIPQRRLELEWEWELEGNIGADFAGWIG